MATLKIISGRFTIDIYKGDDEDILLDSFRDSENNPLNLASLYTNARFQVRQFPRSGKAIVTKTLGDGISFVADSDGNANAAVLISLPKEETAELIEGTLSADFEWTLSDGTVQTMETEEGNQHWIVNIKSDVTR